MIKDIGSILLAVIFLTITAGIISRYIFNKPFDWTEEVCTFLMVYLCYFSAACTTVSKKHIVADFFISRASARFSRMVGILSRVLMVVFFVVICFSVLKLLPSLVWVSPALGIHRKYYYYPVLAMSAFMAFTVIVDLFNDAFPGYDLIAQMNEKEAQRQKEEEAREAGEIQKKMDEFMRQSGYAADGGKKGSDGS